MKRRNVLRYTAYAVSGAALLPLIQSCQSKAGEIGFSPSFFNDNEYAAIRDICDVLLPETDTPGAVSLGVPQFFDHMVGKVFPIEARDNFKLDFNKLLAFLNKTADGGAFANLSAEAKKELLTKLDRKWFSDDSQSDEKAAYLGVRGQAVSYYLSTEYVGTEILNYLPIPGDYKPCITLEEVGGKAWTI